MSRLVAPARARSGAGRPASRRRGRRYGRRPAGRKAGLDAASWCLSGASEPRRRDSRRANGCGCRRRYGRDAGIRRVSHGSGSFQPTVLARRAADWHRGSRAVGRRAVTSRRPTRCRHRERAGRTSPSMRAASPVCTSSSSSASDDETGVQEGGSDGAGAGVPTRHQLSRQPAAAERNRWEFAVTSHP